MDFGTLLHTAQKNERSGKGQVVRYYNTKFEPPKKEQRSKQLSQNIQKFLARKEAEEKQKQHAANKKKEKLLALRAQDKKATRRVNVMLKRTKSANQSVIQEEVEHDNTLAGTAQPDEDDYGYVSQEAAAFYNKMMEKYSKMPDEPKFSLDKKKKASSNLAHTKERVRIALEEANNASQRTRKRKQQHSYHVAEKKKKEDDDDVVVEVAVKTKPKQPLAGPPPPPMNFAELLKIAEKKQFEPIVIEQKPKEEERLFTKKQKKELEREREWRERKEGKTNTVDINRNNKIPKLNDKFKSNGDVQNKLNRPTIPTSNNNNNNNNNNMDDDDVGKSILNKFELVKKPQISDKKQIDKKPILVDKNISANKLNAVPSRNMISSSVPSTSSSSNIKANLTNNKSDLTKRKDLNVKARFPPPPPPQSSSSSSTSMRDNNIPMKSDQKLKQTNSIRPKEKQKDGPPMRKMPMKRRIIDEDDDEHDSELDDFIDDGPIDEEDYSKHIKEIFGYDKSKYRYVDDDEDDANMVSSFAQQMREEVISTKIGIKEDLEDIKREEEEKRRKMLLKKKGKL